jgi:hypothetical protein
MLWHGPRKPTPGPRHLSSSRCVQTRGAHLNFGNVPLSEPEFNGKLERALPTLL